MFYLCRIELLGWLCLLAGCHHASDGVGVTTERTDTGVIASALVPGLIHGASSSDPRAAQYYDNAQAVAEGKRLFNQYNCVGCHSNGGGGMGPALMDDQWIYGDRLEQIHQTLVEGRPNGMPSWAGKVPDPQLWALAAYVRSMSLPQTIAANTGATPSQTPAPVPRAVAQDPGWSPPPGTTNDYTDVTKGPQ
jgi:cytochrome c oxidase cbb3-type subunit 3